MYLLEHVKRASGIWYRLLTWEIYSFNIHHSKESEASTFTEDILSLAPELPQHPLSLLQYSLEEPWLFGQSMECHTGSLYLWI